MKKYPACYLAALCATALAYAGPTDDVAAAAKKLADAPNYSWRVTTEFANSQFPSMPSDGVTEKGGYTVITTTFNDNKRQTVRKGEELVMQNRDGAWVTMEEIRQQFAGGGAGGAGGAARGGGRGGFGMFGGGASMDFAKDVANLAADAKDAKLVDGAIVATLGADAVTSRLTFGRGGGQTPAPKNASGSVKFWLKDGALVKYAVNVKGTVATPNGDEREIDLTTTTEIKDVGTTKVEVPDGAKKKFGA
jgi:hypothetical protein